MIHLGLIAIEGVSDLGPFSGSLTLERGLQVIVANNNFGKTLAGKVVVWCLVSESIYGRPNDDASFFPDAVRTVIDFGDQRSIPVRSSIGRIRLHRDDGETLEISRAITHDREIVHTILTDATGKASHASFNSHRDSMVDRTGGFQNFLFRWLRWPITDILTIEGARASVYAQNIVPLFYIEQAQGWTEPQARQVYRYRQQQIRQVAIEFILGADDVIRARVARQRAEASKKALHATAVALASQIETALIRHGLTVSWSAHGSVEEIVARWSKQTIVGEVEKQAETTFARLKEFQRLKIVALEKQLREGEIDPSNVSAPGAVSQEVIFLKEKRHALHSQLSSLRIQHQEARHLVETLDYRIKSAVDVHRYKSSGIGQLEHVECPTCHRDVDLATFHLTHQTAADVLAHIDTLKRDRATAAGSADALSVSVAKTQAEMAAVDAEFRHAEGALASVTAVVGAAREQIVKIATELSRHERHLARLEETEAQIAELQKAVETWLNEAKQTLSVPVAGDMQARLKVFRDWLVDYLLALGHGAVDHLTASTVSLDVDYEPRIGERKLVLAGSGSDPARLVAAYTLALAAASKEIGGLHPGLVILDEPIQQNPDDEHMEKLLAFFSKKIMTSGAFQVIVFTWLEPDERAILRAAGIRVVDLSGRFLKLDAADVKQGSGGASTL